MYINNTNKYEGCVGNEVANDGTGHSFSITTTTNRDLMTSPHIDASKSNSIYGKSTTVQPPALMVLILIKT